MLIKLKQSNILWVLLLLTLLGIILTSQIVNHNSSSSVSYLSYLNDQVCQYKVKRSKPSEWKEYNSIFKHLLTKEPKFRTFAIEAFQTNLIDSLFKINWKYKAVFFVLAAAILFLLIKFISIIKLASNNKQESLFTKKWNQKVKIKKYYLVILLILLAFLSLCGMVKASQIDQALSATFCSIIEVQADEKRLNVLTNQSISNNLFYEAAFSYQLKLIMLNQRIQKAIKAKPFKNINKYVAEINHFAQDRMFFQKLKKLISTVSQNLLAFAYHTRLMSEFINQLTQTLIIQRSKFINIIKSLDFFMQIQYLLTFPRKFISLILLGVLCGAITNFILLFQQIRNQKGQNTQFLRFCRFFGFISLIALLIGIMLVILASLLHLGCFIQQDLKDHSKFQIYYQHYNNDKQYSMASQLYRKIQGHRSGSLDTIFGVNIYLLAEQINYYYNQLNATIHSPEFIKQERSIIEATQSNNHVNLITNQSYFYQNFTSYMKNFRQCIVNPESYFTLNPQNRQIKIQSFNIEEIQTYKKKIEKQICHKDLQIAEQLGFIMMQIGMIAFLFLLILKYSKVEANKRIQNIQLDIQLQKYSENCNQEVSQNQADQTNEPQTEKNLKEENY